MIIFNDGSLFVALACVEDSRWLDPTSGKSGLAKSVELNVKMSERDSSCCTLILSV